MRRVASLLLIPAITAACDQHASKESIPRVSTGTDRVRAVYPNHGYGATVALSADEAVAYMASFYGLYAYSTATDQLLWHNPSAGTQDPSTGPTVDTDGTIYVGNQTGMHAVNPDGTTKWEYLIPNPGTVGAPWFSTGTAIGPEGHIYAGSWGNLFHAFDRDGNKLWEFHGDRIFNLSCPAIAPDGTVYIGCLDGFLYALNPNGSLRWSHDTSHSIVSSPAIDASGRIFFGSYGGDFFALEADGSLAWQRNLSVHIQGSPVIDAAGDVLCGTDDRLYKMTRDGADVWSVPTPHVESSPLLAADGTIYLQTEGCALMALAGDGTAMWSFDLDQLVLGWTCAPALTSSGKMFLPVNFLVADQGGSNGALVVLQTDSPGVLASPWPQLQRNPQRTGR